MLIFGHLGIGATVVRPWSRGLSRIWLYLGMLAPDLLDKPLYYGLVYITGKHGLELGMLSGTRTFGHTALALILLVLLATKLRSRNLAAFALGFASHLFLDNVGDRLHWNEQLIAQWTGSGLSPYDGLRALLWPLFGTQFPVSPFESIWSHLDIWKHTYFLVTEGLGILLLTWEVWTTRHESEILEFVRARRIFRRLRGRGYWRRS